MPFKGKTLLNSYHWKTPSQTLFVVLITLWSQKPCTYAKSIAAAALIWLVAEKLLLLRTNILNGNGSPHHACYLIDSNCAWMMVFLTEGTCNNHSIFKEDPGLFWVRSIKYYLGCFIDFIVLPEQFYVKSSKIFNYSNFLAGVF